MDIAKLQNGLIKISLIPEHYPTDSSDEKRHAKLSDKAVALALTELGIPASPIKTRSNSADVLGETEKYSLVADAKTSRCRRNPYNQKDFKVGAVSDWRGIADYALIVAPHHVYQSKKGQVYTQAIKQNVTLLTYGRLACLLEYGKGKDLERLWRCADFCRHEDISDAASYWDMNTKIMMKLLNVSREVIESFLDRERKHFLSVAEKARTHCKGKELQRLENNFNRISKQMASLEASTKSKLND
jgi:hypothetical protein